MGGVWDTAGLEQLCMVQDWWCWFWTRPILVETALFLLTLLRRYSYNVWYFGIVDETGRSSRQFPMAIARHIDTFSTRALLTSILSALEAGSRLLSCERFGVISF